MSSNPSAAEAGGDGPDTGGVASEPAPNPAEGPVVLGEGEGEREIGDGSAVVVTEGIEAVNDVTSREAGIDATLREFQDGGLASGPNPGGVQIETVEIGRGEAVETGITEGTAKGPAVEGVKTELLSGRQVEAVEICDGIEHVEEAVSRPDEKQSSVNHTTAGNSQNRVETPVRLTAERVNMSTSLYLGIDQNVNAHARTGETEVGGGSIVADVYQEEYHEASASQTTFVGTNQVICQEGHFISVEEVQMVESLPIDETTVDRADVVSNYSNMDNTVVEREQDLLLIGKNSVVEAGHGDAQSVNDGLIGTGGFLVTDEGTTKVMVDIKTQNAGTHPLDEDAMDKGDTFMTYVSSVTVVPVVEVQSRVDENNCVEGDHVVDTSFFTVETQAAVISSLDEDTKEKLDFVVEDPIPQVKISLLGTSEPSEVQMLASQGEKSCDSPLGDNWEMGTLSVGSLVDGSHGTNTHEVEFSLGRGRMDVESNVLKEGFPASDEGEVELVQKSEAEQQTIAPWDSMADVIMNAGTMQNGKQGLVECSEKQALQETWISYVKDNQHACYELPPQDTAKFSISDLVWGKVKSHPWWPGQIFDYSDASELALKYQRKDNFLVAYFGDGTFAWRDKSQLKHFYTNFSQMERQSSSDAFMYAVNGVLGEVSRRMDLGMTCSCLPEKDYADIKSQQVENAGILEGTDNPFIDRSLIVNYFQTNRFLEYIKSLAQIPTGGADRLELVIAKAQLKGFYRLKGYPELPEFIFGGGLMENDIEASHPWDKKPTEVVVEHSTPMSSESIPGKRKRGRPPKKHKHFGGGLMENDVEVSHPWDKKPTEVAVDHSTPMSSESIPGKRKRGRPPKKHKHFGGGLMENDVEASHPWDKKPTEVSAEQSTPMSSESIPGKRKRGRPPKNDKHILEDRRKRKSLSELMEEKNVSRLTNGGNNWSGVKASGLLNQCSSGKKRKFSEVGYADSGKTKKKRLGILGDLETKPPSSTLGRSFEVGECIDDSGGSKKKGQVSLGDTVTKSLSPALSSSFKVGEYIRRVASQLTGSPPILKSHGETFQESVTKGDHRGGDADSTYAFSYIPVPKRKIKKDFSKDYSSDEMLSQLCLAARDPLKGCSFLSMVVSFFTDFRNSCASSSSDMSTPDYMKDSYWSDMISLSDSGKGLLSNGLQRKIETDMRKQRKKRKSVGQPSPSGLLGPFMDPAQQLQFGTLSPNMKPASAPERSIISVEDKIIDTPTALLLSFNSSDSLPSEADLIRTFGRYGPLREAETEVLKKTNRVKVVFKRRADAEIAFSSAGKFSIFGPALVSYQLKYLPSAPETSPVTTAQGEYLAASMDGNSEVSAQVETGVVSVTAEIEAVGNG